LAEDKYFRDILKNQQQIVQALKAAGAFDRSVQLQVSQTIQAIKALDHSAQQQAAQAAYAMKALDHSVQQQIAPLIQANKIWQNMVSSSSVILQLKLTQQITPLETLFQTAMQTHAYKISALSENFVAYGKLLEDFTQATRGIWNWIPPNFKHLKKALQKRLLAAFAYADLWPVPSMTEEFMYQIADLATKNKFSTVTLLVWNYYARRDHARLKSMISSWWDDPDFAARRPIFEQGLIVHQQKIYAASIPMLLAQVEGIANDFVHNNAVLTVDGHKLKLGKSGQVVLRTLEVTGGIDNVDIDGVDIIQSAMAEAVIQYVQNVSYENIDFASQYAELRRRRALNRHGILHGIQINYYSAMNSLRCFLLLDALYGLRRYAAEIEANQADQATPSA